MKFTEMKRLLVFLWAILMPMLALSTDVHFNLAAPFFNANPAANRIVTLQPMSPFPGNLIWFTSDTNGCFTFSNAWVGDFAGVIKAPPGQIQFQISVTATNLGAVEADSITSQGGIQTHPSTGKSSWTIQAADQRYQLSGTTLSNTFYPLFSNPSNYANLVTVTGIVQSIGGGGYTATNGALPVLAGSRISVSVTSGTNIIAADSQTNAVPGWIASQGGANTNDAVARVTAQGAANTNDATARVLAQGTANTNDASTRITGLSNNVPALAVVAVSNNVPLQIATNGQDRIYLGIPGVSGIPKTIQTLDCTNGSDILLLTIHGGDQYYSAFPAAAGNVVLRAGHGAAANQVAGSLIIGGQTNHDGTFGETTILGPVRGNLVYGTNLPPAGLQSGNLPATVTNTGPLTTAALIQSTNIANGQTNGLAPIAYVGTVIAAQGNANTNDAISRTASLSNNVLSLAILYGTTNVTFGQPNTSQGQVKIIAATNTIGTVGMGMTIAAGDNYYSGSSSPGGSLTLRAGHGIGANQTAGTLTLGGATNYAGGYGPVTILGNVTANSNLTAKTFSGDVSQTTNYQSTNLVGMIPAAIIPTTALSSNVLTATNISGGALNTVSNIASQFSQTASSTNLAGQALVQSTNIANGQTNGLAPITYVATVLAAGTNAAMAAATNLVVAERAALASTNAQIHSDISSTNVATLAALAAGTNAALVTATNLATAERNALIASNSAALAIKVGNANGTATNLTLSGNVTNGTMPFLTSTTNYVGLSGEGWGEYSQITAGVLTNLTQPGWSLNFSGGSVYERSNGHSVWVSATGPATNVWTVVDSSGPSPVSWYAPIINQGHNIGYFDNTNATAQWRSDINSASNALMATSFGTANYATLSGTSSNLVPGTVLGINISFSTNGVNGQYFTNVNAATATNAAPGGNIMSNSFGFFPGGPSWVGDDQALGSATLSGQLWPAMNKPWRGIYSSIPGTNLYSETNFVYIITNFSAIYASTVTNDNSIMFLDLDVGWDGPRLTNWSWIVTNYGTLTCDSNRFPHGLQWLASVCHSNNFKLVTHIYYATNITPFGASESLVSLSGAASFPCYYTNGVGSFPTDSFGHYVVVTTPDTYQGDFQELAHWGIDGVIPADGPGENYQQASFAIGRACLQTLIPYSTPNTYTAPIPTSYVNGKLPMAVISYESPNNDQYHTMGYLTVQNHTGFFYDNTQQGVGAVALRKYLLDFPGQTKANRGGHIMSFYPNIGTINAIVVAMTHGILDQGYKNDSIWGPNWLTDFYAIATNSYWCSVNQDSLQNWPMLALDAGTNNGSVWIEQLSSGSWVAAAFGEGAGGTQGTLNWSSFGWNTNMLVRVSGIYPVYTIVSTNTGGFTFTEGAGSDEIYQFDLFPSLQYNSSGSQLTGVTPNSASPWTNSTPTRIGLWVNGQPSGNPNFVNLGNANEIYVNGAAGTSTNSSSIELGCGGNGAISASVYGYLDSGASPHARIAVKLVTETVGIDVDTLGNVNVTGTNTAKTFVGNGSGLTNIQPAGIIGNITLTNGAGSRFRLDLGATTNLIITPL